MAGKTVGEAGEIPLFFTLIPILALLSNYDQENCLINVGTEGAFKSRLGVSERGSDLVTHPSRGTVHDMRKKVVEQESPEKYESYVAYRFLRRPLSI